MLKSFFFVLYTLFWNFSFYLFVAILVSSLGLLFTNLRNKFSLFICLIVLYSIWGFLLDLDGIFLIFMTAEFTIFLLFLMTYLQLYSNYSFIKSSVNYWYFVLFFSILYLNYTPLGIFFFYTSFYKYSYHIVSSDFYILYYFLFEKLSILTVIITLLISFFSLFFIVMYFSLKLTKAHASNIVKNLYFLRKQVLTKQTTFQNKLYTFQN